MSLLASDCVAKRSKKRADYANEQVVCRSPVNLRCQPVSTSGSAWVIS